MKKVIKLIIAVVIILAIVVIAIKIIPDLGKADNESSNSSSSSSSQSGEGGGNSGEGNGSSQYNPRDPEQYLYKNIFANSPYKDQWETDAYGADLYGVWDQSSLPTGFPTQPNSVTEIDRTSYVGVLDEKIHTGGRQLGVLWVDDTDYEEYYVMFTGTQETFNDLKAQLSQNFVCYDSPEDSWGNDRIVGYYHAFSNEWYLYLSYAEEREWSDEENNFVLTGAWSFTLYAIPKYHPLPKIFQGVNLPTFGFATDKASEIQSYSEGDEDVEWLEYDYQTGAVSGTLGDTWASGELHYYGVTEGQIATYVEVLASAGFEMIKKSANEYGQISWRYQKGEIIILIDLYSEHTQMVINIVNDDIWIP